MMFSPNTRTFSVKSIPPWPLTLWLIRSTIKSHGVYFRWRSALQDHRDLHGPRSYTRPAPKCDCGRLPKAVTLTNWIFPHSLHRQQQRPTSRDPSQNASLILTDTCSRHKRTYAPSEQTHQRKERHFSRSSRSAQHCERHLKITMPRKH